MVGEMTNKCRLKKGLFKPDRFIIILLLFLGLGSLTFAQSLRLPYTFEQIKIGNSSLENHVASMLKDRSGYLWLGTANGLKRFDSKFTTTFKREKNNENSLTHNFVEALCEDNQGRIWVGTTEGICYFDKMKNNFVRIKELNKPDYACLNIICDSKGDIWFTIRDKGLFRIDSKTNKLQNFSHQDIDKKTITSNRILRKGLVEDPYKKGIWIDCINGLNFLDFSSQQIHNQHFNPKNTPILSLPNVSAFTVNEHSLVFSNNVSQEITWYDSQLQKITKTYKPTLSSGNTLFEIYQLFFDRNGNLWVSSFNNSMAYIDLKKNITIEVEYEKGSNTSFSAYKFTDVLQEKNGTIWFSTLNGISIINGIAAFNPNDKLFDIYDFSKTIFKNYPKDGIHDLIENSTDSTWWINTLESRLINYNPVSNQYKEFRIPDSKINQSTYNYATFLHDYHNQILAFKPYSFFIFNKSSKRFSEIRLPKTINPLLATSIGLTKLLGDSVWVFGRDITEVFNYHLIKKTWKVYPLKLNLGDKNKILQKHFSPSIALNTRNGDFWIAIHSGGLAKFSKEKQAFIGIKTKQDIDFSKIGFSGFVEDKNGKFWIGSYNLIKFDPLTNDFLSVLDNDLIGYLAIDDYDNICMSILDQVMFFNEKKNEKFTFTFQINESFRNWGNRLINLKNNIIASVTQHGLVLINYKNLKSPSFKNQLYINRISNADTSILIHKNNNFVDFNSSQNSISIDYGILIPPSNNIYKFSYQLEGYDKEWVQDKEEKKEAVYGRLDGGNYIFKVKATDINGNTLPIQTLNIHIDTIFYKTLWFKILSFSIFLFIGFAFYRYQTNQRLKIHHLQMQSTRLEKDKTEIQYQNLINHLNPHFLFNSLTSLNGLILSEPDVASDFLQKLSKIYRYILQNKENEVVSLEQELEFVQNYIDLQKSRFDEGLQVNINIEDHYLQSGIVPVTLQNLFENAIKHNTIEEEKPLIIDVFIEDEHLIVKNNLQKKKFVETSNKQGLDSLKSLYKYLTTNHLETIETTTEFIVKVPLL
jgi:sensor histidine kinase YesM/streptogramin lyase